MMRMQDARTPDGETIRVPFVSGASVRHSVRDALAWILVDALDLPDGSLSKATVDLLWSGGALTATGAQTDLSGMRTRHELLPQLPLLGYSFGNEIVTSKLRVTNVHMACEENRWRLPASVRRMPAASVRAVEWLGEEFGTRHDTAGGPTDRLIAETMFGDAPATTQMIFDTQIVRPGSVWFFALDLECAVPGEVDALAAALHRLTSAGTWHLGAKRAQGFARCAVTAMDTTGVGDLAEGYARHVDHIRGHRDAILSALGAGS